MSSTAVKLTVNTFQSLGGTTKQIRRLVDPSNPKWSAFNPCIGYDIDKSSGVFFLLRSSNYFLDSTYQLIRTTANQPITNHLWLADFNPLTEKLENIRQVSFNSHLSLTRGVEDARLFYRDGNWYFHAVMLEASHTKQPRVAIFSLNLESATATLIEKLDSPELQKVEKNWMTTYQDQNSNFDFIYSPNRFFSTTTKTITAPTISNHPLLHNLRGGTSLYKLTNQKVDYISVCHRTTYEDIYGYDPATFSYRHRQSRKYSHCFVGYDSKGMVTHISENFVFESHGIEFATGLIELDGNLLISYGKDDTSSRLAKIKTEVAVQTLNPVPTQH